MDEQFELQLRRGLDQLIEPVTGGYPHWESSPAAARVAGRGLVDLSLVAGRWTHRMPWAGTRRPRLAWVLVVVALLLALLAIVGIGGSQRETIRPAPPLPAVIGPVEPSAVLAAPVVRHPQPLAPTGIEILSPDYGDYGTAVVDADGETIWLLSPRGLAAYRPAEGTASSWTAADDPAFLYGQSLTLARAGTGGVWLVGDTLRLFDGGGRFRDVVPAPGAVVTATEAPDGTLWAAIDDGSVHHWDGAAWSTVADPGPVSEPWRLVMAVDAEGSPWIGGLANGTGIGRFDAGAWHTYARVDAEPLGAEVHSITPLSGGAVLVATAGGVARFDGSTWTTLMTSTTGLGSASTVGVGPDGSLWVATADTDTGAVSVGRSRDGTWTTWGPADGLPDNQGWLTPSILPTRDAVYAAAGYGLRRLDVDHWTRAWPTAFATGPTWVMSLLPVSRDEAWAGDQDGLWHFVDGAWTLDRPTPEATEGRIADLALIGGTVWAATSEGVLRLDDSGWAIVDQRPAEALAAGPDGSVWIGAGGGNANLLWTLRREGGAWTVRDVPDPPDLKGITTLAIAPDGTAWAGMNVMGMGGLVRLDGEAWTLERPLGPDDQDQAAWDLAITPRGEVWAAVNDTVARHDGSGWTPYLAGNGEVPSAGWDSLAVAPDGVVWGATSNGPVRFTGTRWEAAEPAVALEHLWIAPDGSVWGAMPDGVARLTSE